MDVLGRPCAVVCPAFPAQQRGLQAGYLTAIRPSAQPIHLPTLLTRQSRRKVAAVGLEAVRAGVGCLSDCLVEARRDGAELLVVDALTDMDLHTVLDAALRALPGALLCGSAGLVGALAADYAQPARHEAASRPVPVDLSAALLVIGSGSAMAHRQIEYLRRHHPVAVLEPGAELPAGHTGDILLHLPAPQPGAALDGPAARRMAERLADAALPLIAAIRAGAAGALRRRHRDQPARSHWRDRAGRPA